jgi:hypothetical protein
MNQAERQGGMTILESMTINRYCSNCSHFDVDGTKYHNACPHNTRPVAKAGEAFFEPCGNWVPAGGPLDSSDLEVEDTSTCSMPAGPRIPSGVFSECSWACRGHGRDCLDPYCNGRFYRYLLRYPTEVVNERVCLFVLANPSIATPEETDPTLTRCLGYAARWGYGWAWLGNVCAWRETDPKLLPFGAKAIGPMNYHYLSEAVCAAELVVCGWGKLGGERAAEVLEIIRQAGKTPHALKLNGDGSPAHPLYLRGDLRPFAMGSSRQGRASRGST